MLHFSEVDAAKLLLFCEMHKYTYHFMPQYRTSSSLHYISTVSCERKRTGDYTPYIHTSIVLVLYSYQLPILHYFQLSTALNTKHSTKLRRSRRGRLYSLLLYRTLSNFICTKLTETARNRQRHFNMLYLCTRIHNTVVNIK